MKNKIFIVLAFAGATFLNSCARNPVTGKKQLVLMSEAQELQMGREADPQVIAQYGLYEDPKLQAFINEKGKAMAAVSHRPGLDYQFRVVESEVVNAFAIPGYVYFTRGIMAHFNNEAEFAGVLGHEIGHITARHSVQQQTNATLGQVGLLAGMIVSPAIAQFGQQASQGLGLMLLKFGRDAEREADRLGVEYSSKINYDATEMADFFNTLKRKAGERSQELPSFLSTHPDPGERNQTVAKLADEWKRQLNLTNPQINRNSYLQRIDGLIYGEDPKQGYREGNMFYHPELRFQFAIPSGWQYQNTPSQVQLAEPNGKAIEILTLAQGSNLQEAAQASLQRYGLTARESSNTTINGLPAIAVVADQAPQQQGAAVTVRSINYFVQYNNAIYHLIGVTSVNDFQAFLPTFQSSLGSFRQLTDQARINKKAERIRIRTVNANTQLGQALRNFNMPQARLEELAVLNGMLLTDNVAAGTMIKIFGE